MQQQEISPRHPECPEGYVFIGNMSRASLNKLDWKTKRDGQICYDPEGRLIPQGKAIPEQRFVPVFVRRDEFEARQGTPVFFPA